MKQKAQANLILLLAVLSGVCGIAYEILYSRMISTYFGDIFYVSAAILIGFLASIGIGALVAHRFVKYLPYIEMGIGAYALGAAYVFSHSAAELVSTLTSFGTFSTPVVLVPAVIGLLLVPAMLIGFSIPLFSIYLTHFRPREDISAGFRHIYWVYNIGAALSVIAIEFLLIHLYGIIAAIISIAALNFLIGVVLLFVSKPPGESQRAASHRTDRPTRTFFAALFVASIASGIFQLLFLKVSHSIFGPLNENFAIVLATLFVGIALGSWIAESTRFRFIHALLTGSIVVVATFAVTLGVIYIWAYTQSVLTFTQQFDVLTKIALLFIWGIGSFTIFGSTVPLFLKERPGDAYITPGRTLAISAFGNAAGFFVMIFFLYEFFSLPAIAITIALLLLVAAVYATAKATPARPRTYNATIVLLMLGGIGLQMMWPQTLLSAGYEPLQKRQTIEFLQNEVVSVETAKKFNQSAKLLHFQDGSMWLSYNGYLSLGFNNSNNITLQESIVGASGALFSKKHEDALVLGLGSGITAGTAAEIYMDTTVVEIHPAMRKIAKNFREKNFNITENPSVEFITQDGIVQLITDEKKYDLIINTISSPVYFSASKLWTKDAFSYAKERLREGGVYSTWIDLRMGKEGVRTTLRTLEESFAKCNYIFLNTGYFNAVCGGKNLAFNENSSEIIAESVKRRIEQTDTKSTAATFLKHLIVVPSFQQEKAYTASTPLNTLNHPVLEFLSSPSRVNDDEARDFLQKFASRSFIVSPVNGKELSDKEVKARCSDINRIIQNEGVLQDFFSDCRSLL